MKAVVHCAWARGASPQKGRRAIIAALGAGMVPDFRAWAEPSGPSYRLGILDFGQPDASAGEIDAFISQLAKLGFVEGKNLAIDRRFAHGDRGRLDVLAAELVALKPDVIFTATGRLGAQAAMRATK